MHDFRNPYVEANKKLSATIDQMLADNDAMKTELIKNSAPTGSVFDDQAIHQFTVLLLGHIDRHNTQLRKLKAMT